MPPLAKTIIILASAFVFTVLGLATGVAIMWNRSPDFRDHEGVATFFMIAVPTVGGLVAGTLLGLFACFITEPLKK
jgi:hypothetical protein